VTTTFEAPSGNSAVGEITHSLHLTPWLELLTIKKKDLTVEKWSPDEPFAWAQNILKAEIERQYNLGLPVRIIVLKGRQLGCSTITEGTLFTWCFLHPGTSALVLAHDSKASRGLFDMSRLMWDNWPLKQLFTEKHSTINLLSWVETGSQMSVATARNQGSGRSYTYHAVHCSEVAFWEENGADPEKLMVGLNQTVPYKHGTIIILESTANGIGNYFHTEWQRAVHRQSRFVPLFFPWYKHEEYSFPKTTLRRQDLNQEERELLIRYAADGMTVANLAWRRWAIQDTCLGDANQFKQEYPCSPEEAFLSTGRNVFPLQKLEQAYHPLTGVQGYLFNNSGRIEFAKDVSRELTIFKYPGRDKFTHQYMVAGDPTRTTYGDFACIQVFNRRTWEQVAVWHGHIDPVAFASKIMELGWYYNEAEVTCEIEGPGYATIGAIVSSGYPRVWRHRWADKAQGKVAQSYGWSTSRNRKHMAMAQITNLLSTGSLTLHDDITYEQMRDYVVLDNWGEMGNASARGNDDAVMATAIAIGCHFLEPKLPHERPGEPTYNDLFDEPLSEAFT
jgi:hypothetical protein